MCEKELLILLFIVIQLSYGFYFELDNKSVKCFKEHYGSDQLISGDVIKDNHALKLKFWVRTIHFIYCIILICVD